MHDDYLGSRDLASEAQSRAREAESHVEFLKQDVKRLRTLTEALWMLLKRAYNCSDADLRNVISEIEQREKTGPLLCPACDRVVTVRQKACMYCGQALLQDPFA